jgi:hypothetical protein
MSRSPIRNAELRPACCHSPGCDHARVVGRTFCTKHVALFERVAGQLTMSFRHGKPAHLVVDDRGSTT